MFGHRRLYAIAKTYITLIVTSLFLSACLRAEAFSRDDDPREEMYRSAELDRGLAVIDGNISAGMRAAIDQGIIVPPGASHGLGREWELAEARIGNIKIEDERFARAVYINHVFINFERHNGRIEGIYVEEGQRVRQGDLLAEQIFDIHPDMQAQRLQMQRYRAVFDLEQHLHSFQNEYIEWLIDLDEARLLAELEDGPQYLIELARMEAAYQQFILTSENSRRIYEQRIRDIDDNPLLREGLYAPFDGIIMTVAARARMLTELQWGQLSYVVRLWDENSAYFEMWGNPIETRYGQIFTLEGFEGELLFEARVVSDLVAPGRFPVLQPEEARMRFLLLPVDQAAFDEALAALGITFFDLAKEQITFSALPYEPDLLSPEGVILPLRAISNENHINYVYIYENGRQFRRNVIVGASHGRFYTGYVHILSGLEAGQLVVIP